MEHLSAIPVGEVDRIGSGKIRQTIMEVSNNIFTSIMATIISHIMFAGENSLIVEDALKRVDDILNIRPFGQLENPKRVFRHDIRIENLSFGYDSSNRLAINNINIRINMLIEKTPFPIFCIRL